MTEERQEELIEELLYLQDEIAKAKELVKGLVQKKEVWSDEMKKELLARVRTLHAEVKPKREEIKRLRNEVKVLTETRNALEQNFIKGLQEREEMERANGQGGDLFDSLQKREDVADKKVDVDRTKMGNLEGMSRFSVHLIDAIAEKKEQFEPLLDQIRYIREELADLSLEHELGKNEYKKMKEEVEKEYTIIMKDMKGMKGQIEKNDLEFCIYKMKLRKLKFERKFLREASSSPNALRLHPIGTFKEKITKKIREEEARKEILLREAERLKTNEADLLFQLSIWNNLKSIFDLKVQAKKREKELETMGFDSVSFTNTRSNHEESYKEEDSSFDEL